MILIILEEDVIENSKKSKISNLTSEIKNTEDSDEDIMVSINQFLTNNL